MYRQHSSSHSASRPSASRTPRATLATVVLDCADAPELAAFYGQLLDWPVTAREPDWVLMRCPEGGAGLAFQAEPGYVPPVWPEDPGQHPAAQQKMLHLDLRVDDLAASTEYAVSLGAALAPWQPQDDVRVLLDPAGHPFCLFRDAAGPEPA